MFAFRMEVTCYRCPLCGLFTTAEGDCDHKDRNANVQCTDCGRFVRPDDPQQHTCATRAFLSENGRKGIAARKRQGWKPPSPMW